MTSTKSEDQNQPSINLIGSQCGCGIITVPPVNFCRICNKKPEEISVTPQGKILACTRVHVTAKGFLAPLGIALVELQCGAKVMCNTQSGQTYQIDEEVKILMKDGRLMICE